MQIPESREVIIQRISTDPRVISCISDSMLRNTVDFDAEIKLAETISQEYGVDVDTVSAGADIALAEIDRAILEGRVSIE